MLSIDKFHNLYSTLAIVYTKVFMISVVRRKTNESNNTKYNIE
jgi:hypothetical protein